MSNPRKATASLTFNGKKVDVALTDYLESVSYTDVADGSSDEIQIEVQDSDLIWMHEWAPKKGDLITGSFSYENWNKDGKNLKLVCGDFILDEVKFTGGPRVLKMSALAVPSSNNFKIRERTKTWKKITIRKILRQIARRYKLKYSYFAGSVYITKLEQSNKTDSAFLYELCKKYGLGMKVFRSRIIVYDKGTFEKRAYVATLTPGDFIEDSWDYSSDLQGTYTGCRITYKTQKKKKKSKSLSAYVGIKSETAKGSRVKKLNQQCSTVKEARQIAAAEVNKSNEEAEVFSGEILANPKICAACCVQLKGFGNADGRYFIDKCTTSVDGGGAKQSLEMHKVQRRVTASATKQTKK